MSSLDRTLDGPVLVHHLPRGEQLIDQQLLARTGRSARTLVKEGPLRLTLIALAPGGVLPTHHAEGPVSIQAVEGEVHLEAQGTDYLLREGDVLVLAAGLEHSARSDMGGVLLLTLAQKSAA